MSTAMPIALFSRRAVSVFLLSALLHWLVLSSTGRLWHATTTINSTPASQIDAVFVTLPIHLASPAPAMQTRPNKAHPISKPLPKPARASLLAASAPLNAANALADKVAVVVEPAFADNAVVEAATPTTSGADTASNGVDNMTGTSPPPVKPATPASAPSLPVVLPPSAYIKFAVIAKQKGGDYFANAFYDWKLEQARYKLKTEVGVLFLSATYASTGSIDEYGIAPLLYEEKPPRRSLVVTHFNRENSATPSISFSASTAQFPLPAGSQDRATVVFQLAGMVRGAARQNPAKVWANGEALEFFVAGARDAEPWIFVFRGEEKIPSDVAEKSGGTSAYHFQRLPREGSYQQILDVWLSNEHDYLPIKLRFSEKNEDFVELNATRIN